MIRLFEAFAGYGTSCFALKQLGIEYELVGFSEIDKYAIKCFEQNHGGKNFGDITKINWKEVPDFDLLTGGFPCQSFSTAGKQLGEKDSRGILGLELTRALIAKQPKYFLFENVKGFMSKRFLETREKFVKSWEDAGYKVQFKVLNTKDFGVPQNRERVWFVGIRKDVEQTFEFPVPFKLELKLKDVLEDKVDKKYFLRQEQVEKLFTKMRSQKDRLQNDDCSKVLCTRDYKSPKCIELTKDVSQAMRVFDSDGVGCALRGLGGGMGAKTGLYSILDLYNNKEHFDRSPSLTEPHHNSLRVREGMRVRRLTPKECFRLQGFLNDEINLEFLSDTQKYKLAGNGQSVNVVKLLFKELLKEIEGVGE